MKQVISSSLTALILLSSAHAFAQAANEAESTSETEPSAPEDDASSSGATAGAELTLAPAAEASAKVDAETKADGDAKPAPELEPVAVENPEVGSVGINTKIGNFSLSLYGFAALNAIYDTTQSFELGSNNTILARNGTYEGDHDQFVLSARDSRIGMRLGLPPAGQVTASANIEVDFNGIQPAEYDEDDKLANPLLRMRHYYALIETPIVDVLAGQYHDLFGWGGKGFYPNTLAFMGITGQVFHRQPQLRLSKTFKGEALDFEIAAAVTKAAHAAAGLPDAQAGIRLAVNGWKGARTQGYGQTSLGALALGVSAVTRRFRLPEFMERPGDYKEAAGLGLAINAYIPVIPARSKEDHGNSLSLTGEFSTGSGTSDLYTELTGGALYPTLANPNNATPPPYYLANADSGIVTFDGNGRLHAIQWQGLVVGLQYYLPIDGGRVWVAANYSRVKSDNIKELTPIPARGAIFTEASYFDASLFWAMTRAIQVGVSGQVVKQTFGDDVDGENRRGEFALHVFF